MYLSLASFSRMVTTYSLPVFLTMRMWSPTIPKAYVFMIADEIVEWRSWSGIALHRRWNCWRGSRLSSWPVGWQAIAKIAYVSRVKSRHMTKGSSSQTMVWYAAHCMWMTKGWCMLAVCQNKVWGSLVCSPLIVMTKGALHRDNHMVNHLVDHLVSQKPFLGDLTARQIWLNPNRAPAAG